ncbi:DUF3263 domain-containing protein [Leifsonia sp. WHRI 6310E]|uniref:DUF3263 domain-containing protein n=1 Tax=Leifsonia sp. WHRI 6310E TaxID=3162562 RepID=UPI0032EE2EE5
MSYLPEPETRAEKAQAYRAAARMRGAGAVFDALVTRRGPFPAFYDIAAVLSFEREHPHQGGLKEQAIREVFGVSATRYAQRLHHLIHNDEAAARAADPHTVKRLLHLEQERAEGRRHRTEGATS